jgi:hypothetical protein
MNRLRLLGLTLISVFALGAIVAATAVAEEAGFLYLAKESGVVTFTGSGGAGKLKTAAGSIKCTETKVEEGESNASETTHIRLGKLKVHFLGCKQVKGKSELACNSEGATKESILLTLDWHLVNVRVNNVLRPGIFILLLKIVILECGGGTAKVEIKGNVLGESSPTLESEDAKVIAYKFLGGSTVTCDSEDALCLTLAKEPLEANFSGKFEPAEEETEVSTTANKMVKVDF